MNRKTGLPDPGRLKFVAEFSPFAAQTLALLLTETRTHTNRMDYIPQRQPYREHRIFGDGHVGILANQSLACPGPRD